MIRYLKIFHTPAQDGIVCYYCEDFNIKGVHEFVYTDTYITESLAELLELFECNDQRLFNVNQKITGTHSVRAAITNVTKATYKYSVPPTLCPVTLSDRGYFVLFLNENDLGTHKQKRIRFDRAEFDTQKIVELISQHLRLN